MKKNKQQNGQTAELKRQVQKEINMNKVSIDRSVFAKTEDEKSRLKFAKKMYRKSLLVK